MKHLAKNKKIDVEKKSIILVEEIYFMLMYKIFSVIRSRDMYTAKFLGALSKASYLVRPPETRNGGPNSHKIPRNCGRAANDEKIDRNLISKALSFYENTCIRVRRESAGNIVIRIQRSRTLFPYVCDEMKFAEQSPQTFKLSRLLPQAYARGTLHGFPL